jgi:transcriptional regulator with XRE-family HTH domain
MGKEEPSMSMISRKVKEAVKLSDLKGYEIAHLAGIHPSTLSRIVNGIDEVKPGDPRVIRIAKVLGLRPEDCFEQGENL